VEPTDDSSSSSSDSLSDGAIAGIAIGGAAGVALLGLGLYFGTRGATASSSLTKGITSSSA
jgi:hypothetical protein